MAIATPAEASRALARGGKLAGAYLLHGVDEAASRALAGQIGATLGSDAERVDIAAATLRSSPSELLTEAQSLSLFGAPRWLRVDPAGDECTAAVAAQLAAATTAHPVVLVSGQLRRDSKLLAEIGRHPRGLSVESRPLSLREGDRLAAELARDVGLLAAPDIARRLFEIAGGDRAILQREFEKYASFLDAAPEQPAELDAATIDALAAGSEGSDTRRVADAMLGGRPDLVADELRRLADDGVSGIGVVRPVLRRAFDIARHGAGSGARHPAAEALAGRWAPADIAQVIDRLGEVERTIKSANYVGPAAADGTFIAVARAAARRR